MLIALQAKRESNSIIIIGASILHVAKAIDQTENQLKKIMDLNYTLNKNDLIGTPSIYHPIAKENMFFLKHTLNILQDRSMLGHKTNLNKFRETEIISSIFSGMPEWFSRLSICLCLRS